MSNLTTVLCPKCKSASTHAEKRGWNVFTGIIGSGKIVITCLNCGNRFKPGQGWKEPESEVSVGDQTIGWLVLLGFIIVVTLLFRYC